MASRRASRSPSRATPIRTEKADSTRESGRTTLMSPMETAWISRPKPRGTTAKPSSQMRFVSVAARSSPKRENTSSSANARSRVAIPCFCRAVAVA
jgi:hypothetical protein